MTQPNVRFLVSELDRDIDSYSIVDIREQDAGSVIPAPAAERAVVRRKLMATVDHYADMLIRGTADKLAVVRMDDDRQAETRTVAVDRYTTRRSIMIHVGRAVDAILAGDAVELVLERAK